jgi:plasmid stability protein
MDDPRVIEAKAKPMDDVLAVLQVSNLKRAGVERIGPCPLCGGDDRFSVNTRKALFQCRRCGAKGDQIALVQFVRGVDFRVALEWLCGPAQEISPAERAAREARDRQNKARKDREEAGFRQRATAEARAIWRAGLPAEGSPVRDYLALRGLTRDRLPTLPASLRFAPDLPYMVQARSGQWIEAHRGPAMLAAIQGPDGPGSAVHRTWFDLAAPQGKVQILHPETGAPQARKKSWGSKKGGAIRLTRGIAPVLVMGEGIETTLTAMVAGAFPGAACWAGIDLGNMAGRQASGPGLRYAGLPDLEDDQAFVPPDWVCELVYVMDGDSDPRATRAKLETGLRRAMLRRPGLVGRIAVCPTGADLNDVLMDRAGEQVPLSEQVRT